MGVVSEAVLDLLDGVAVLKWAFRSASSQSVQPRSFEPKTVSNIGSDNAHVSPSVPLHRGYGLHPYASDMRG